ncbi:hypothetical protein MGSAQ_001483 [marine sediment metagenome]|uniref:Uncharacterized protein n=1 Tax=marine sediment metagenome TaxID=412755 RepID=A0A1B6NUM4_9ZZZZ
MIYDGLYKAKNGLASTHYWQNLGVGIDMAKKKTLL